MEHRLARRFSWKRQREPRKNCPLGLQAAGIVDVGIKVLELLIKKIGGAHADEPVTFR